MRLDLTNGDVAEVDVIEQHSREENQRKDLQPQHIKNNTCHDDLSTQGKKGKDDKASK